MDHSNATTIRTTDLSVTLTGLQQRTEYGIHVRAKTQQGWGDYSPIIFKTTGQVLNTGKGNVDFCFIIFLRFAYEFDN